MPVSAKHLQPAAELFKALGDETRLRIVALLSHGDLCVCHLEDALGLAQPAVSRHLAVLKNAGVVNARRAGNWVHYALAPQVDLKRELQLKTLARAFGGDVKLGREVRRLVKTRGPASCR